MINEVIARLKTHAPGLTDVLPAVDLEALKQGVAARHGTAYVLPYREKGEPTEQSTGGYRQFVAVQLLVAFVVRKHDDVKGGKKVLDFDGLKTSIEGALAGWAVAPQNDLFELVAAQAGSLGNGASVYVQTWQTSRYIRKA